MEGGLNFLANADVPYSVELCSGEQKEFMKCTSWELLNLKPSTILNIPQDLYEGYGISQTFLQNVMQPYLVQSKGMGYMERFVGMKHQSVYYVGTTMHYSWPKGAGKALDIRLLSSTSL